MIIEMIATGEELLDGRVANTNARDLAAELKANGLALSRETTVGDDPKVLTAVFREVAQRADAAIITGGLGPTDDDRTAEVLAGLAGVPLTFRTEWMERLEAYFQRLNRPMSESNKKQAYLPEGSDIIDNPGGTAAGISMQIDGCHFFALPGVPWEMRNMVRDHVIPALLDMAGDTITPPVIHTFKSFGMGESQVADLLKSLYPLPPGVDIGYRAKFPEIHLSLKIFPNLFSGDVEVQHNTYCDFIRKQLVKVLFTEDPDESFVGSLGRLLLERGRTLAMAESCTGGLVGSMLTEESGSSAFFLASAVTYSNEAKHDILGVEQTLLDQHGAVSEPVARAMAEGARRIAHADIAAAITGVAGPTGGTPEKPVGTVHIAVATATDTRHKLLQLGGNRHRIRTLSAYAALQMVRRTLIGEQ